MFNIKEKLVMGIKPMAAGRAIPVYKESMKTKADR
jgi:hypothetical protein